VRNQNLKAINTLFAGTSSACTGDTGGGFVVYYNGAMRVIGVASKVFISNGACVTTKADGYVRVGAFIEWIVETAVDEPESCPICPISCN
jgi:secreted trypsin-like serine protease